MYPAGLFFSEKAYDEALREMQDQPTIHDYYREAYAAELIGLSDEPEEEFGPWRELLDPAYKSVRVNEGADEGLPF